MVISNRIFETYLYDLFLSEHEMNNRIFRDGISDKNQFIQICYNFIFADKFSCPDSFILVKVETE